MKIRILTVGKIKEKFYRDAIAEYQKRLGRYCKLEIVEVAEQVKEKEGQRLLSHIRDGEYCIVLAIEGKKLDSVTFSQQIDRLMVSGTSTIDFVIGGSLGLYKDVLSRADFLLRFSDMTFPHQLMRVILLEQVYRAFRISNKEPYHK